MSLRVGEEDLCCPVCHGVFVDPVVLLCSHSLCRHCLLSWWSEKGQRECPICKSVSPQSDPPSNRALRHLCESLRVERVWSSPDRSAVCGLHQEKLTLFCLEHQDPVCLVCRDAEKHVGHRFRPLDEAAQHHKHKLDELLRPLRARLERFDQVQTHYQSTLCHVAAQAQRSEEHIHQDFQQLYKFLRQEEASRLEALKAEERQKEGRMRDRAQELRQQVAPLRDVVLAAEEQLKAEPVAFLQQYKNTAGRVQRCPLLEEPAPVTDSLIDETRHVGNLLYSVWTNMAELVEFSPVLFDPNTLDPQMTLSRDLSAVSRADQEEELPSNPERFSKYFAVLGSQGYSSGTAQWEVDVSSSSQWRVGVLGHALPLEQAQWVLWLFNGVLAAQAPGTPLSVLRDLPRAPRRVRLTLDCDAGHVTFTDPQQNAQIHTLRFTPGLKMFPFVKTWDTVGIVRGRVSANVEFRSEPEENEKSNVFKMLQNMSSRKKVTSARDLLSYGARRRELQTRREEEEDEEDEEDEIAVQKRLNKRLELQEVRRLEEGLDTTAPEEELGGEEERNRGASLEEKDVKVKERDTDQHWTATEKMEPASHSLMG